MGGEKQITKCVDDNPTVAGSIVDYGSRFFGGSPTLWGLPDSLHIYEGCAFLLLIEEALRQPYYDDYVIYHEKHFIVESK